MILRLLGKHGFRWPRLGIVTGLIVALLAFPCGPLVAALGLGADHAHAAAKVTPVHSEHGNAECTHRTSKHESSCCKSCSSWATARFFDGAKAIVGHASHYELPAVTLAYAATHLTLDGDPRRTGPPLVASLDGISIYLKTRRLRI